MNGSNIAAAKEIIHSWSTWMSQEVRINGFEGPRFLRELLRVGWGCRGVWG